LKQNHKFLNTLRIFSCNDEHIHSFRICIKKHKALLKLYKPVIGKKEYSLYISRLKLLFKKAKILREHQAYYKLAKELQSKQLQNAIKQKMKQQQPGLYNYINKHKPQIFSEFKKLNKRFYEIKKSVLNKYYKKKYHKLSAGLHKVNKRVVHELRKNIKEYYYNIKFFSDESLKIIPQKYNHVVLNKLQEKIGIWHDLSLLQRKLKSGFYRVDNRTKKELLILIENKTEQAWNDIIKISGSLLNKS
jgi:CHAD domain-containing protein